MEREPEGGKERIDEQDTDSGHSFVTSVVHAHASAHVSSLSNHAVGDFGQRIRGYRKMEYARQ